MNDVVHSFFIRRLQDNSWVVLTQSGRVLVRSPYKDTTLELARHIGRGHAPSVVILDSNNGREKQSWSYRTPR